MHCILKKQLRKLGLDKENPPQTLEEWDAFLQHVGMAYSQADEGFYTPERSGGVSPGEMEQLNEQLRQSKELLEAKVIERTKNLEESEARNNAFLSMAPSAIIILDRQGCIIEFNASAEEMYDCNRNDVLGKVAFDVIIPERFRAVHTATLENFDGSSMGIITPKPLELPSLRADGSEFSTEMTLSAFRINEKLFFTAAIQDITQRKITEQKLTQLASFPAENDEPVLRINRIGVVEYANESGLEVLNYWGFEIGDVFTGELAAIIERVFENNVKEFHEQVVGDKAYMLRFVPIVKSGYINVYGADQTVQKAYELALVEARDLAEQSNNAKSQFLAMMSHEIRTPMNGVMGMTELLRKTTLDEKQKHYADNIACSANALLRIIDDILDISKIDADKLELEVKDFSIAALINELSESFSEQLNETQLELKVSISADVPEVMRSDSVRLRQVLINLIGNAIKFTRSGEIKVLISVTESNASSRQILFEVSDDGVGMDQDTCARIFNPFSQADQSTTRVYGGTGLGLTIVKRLVEMMDGEVGVDSELSKGSRFWFTIRMQKPKVIHLAEKEIADSDGTFIYAKENNGTINIKSSEKLVNSSAKRIPRLIILLAEDNVTNQEVALDMLDSLGHEVDVVSNGREALDAFKDKKYDLVFMDCRMPEMDGYEATQHIRDFEREKGNVFPVPIIALTANAMLSDKDKCKKVGMDDFISKPFSLEDLQSAIRH